MSIPASHYNAIIRAAEAARDTYIADEEKRHVSNLIALIDTARLLFAHGDPAVRDSQRLIASLAEEGLS